VQAECLMSFCKIEQAHLVYVRGLQYSPGSKQVSKKIKECQETIVCKLGSEESFVFKGSTIFFDYLQDMGCGSIDNYLLEDDVKLSLNKLANMMSGLKKKPFGVKDSIWNEKDTKANKVNFDAIIKRKKKTGMEKKKMVKASSVNEKHEDKKQKEYTAKRKERTDKEYLENLQTRLVPLKYPQEYDMR
jgi:hypothetical protein